MSIPFKSNLDRKKYISFVSGDNLQIKALDDKKYFF